MRTVWFLSVAAALLGLVTAAWGSGPRDAAPPGARVGTFASQGLKIDGALGSWCLPTSTGGICADAVYSAKPTRGRLPVKAGGTLRFLAGAPALHVDVGLMRTTSTGNGQRLVALHARPIGSSGEIWQVRLPRAVNRTDVVDAFVRYSYGDASFSARVRPGGCG